MMRKPNLSSKTLIAASVAAAFSLSAGAFAQTTTSHDSSDVDAANSPAARQVTLTNQQSSQTLRYSRARNLRICNLTGRTQSLSSSVNAAETRAPEDRANLATRAAAAPPTPVALQLSYSGTNEQIQPGNCYDFRARAVRLSTSNTLPTGGMLVVSILPVSANGFVNGRTLAASSSDYGATKSSETSGKESVSELKEQLKRDDEQERQANAELAHARENLEQTTRDLKQAESKERHVASAEHQTEQAEHQAQQSADQSRQNADRSQQNADQSQNDGTPR